MNTKEYIESGILEAYVLDALSQAERSVVASNIAMYPELAQEVAEIEKSLFGLAEAGAITPPAHLQDKIWMAVHASPVPAHKTIPLPAPAKGSTSWLRAAVWVALVGSLLVNAYLWSERNKANEQQQALLQKVNTMSEQQALLTSRLNAYDHERSMLADANVQPVMMQSTQQGQSMTGMALFNKTKGEVYVSMLNMPMPPEGMQYQFWVIKDGKPVDMGMLPNDMIIKGGMQKVSMPSSEGAQAFAISLEKAGGNPTPTEVKVVGKIIS